MDYFNIACENIQVAEMSKLQNIYSAIEFQYCKQALLATVLRERAVRITIKGREDIHKRHKIELQNAIHTAREEHAKLSAAINIFLGTDPDIDTDLDNKRLFDKYMNDAKKVPLVNAKIVNITTRDEFSLT